MGDRESGRNKGFGFATFEDLPDAQLEQLTKQGGWDIDGKMVRTFGTQRISICLLTKPLGGDQTCSTKICQTK